jgi:hypothetical protein
MKKKDLLRQLNNLQSTIKPDQVWKEKGREILHAQITAQTSSVSPKVLSHAISNKILFSILRPVSVTLAIFIAVIGVWVAGVSATKNSLPGDLLYGLKLTGERLQVNLALSDEKRTDLEMAFAEIRLNEVKQVMSKSKDKDKLALSLKKYQESMTNIKSNLAKLEMTDKSKALKVANLVDEKAKVYTDLLRGENITQDKNTAEAIVVSKATSDKALSVILNDFESGNSTVTLEEIKSKIDIRIADIRKDNEVAKKNIETIIINKAKADELAKAEEEARIKAEAEAKAKAEAEAKAQAEADAKTQLEAENTAATGTDSSINTETTQNQTEQNPVDLSTNANTNSNTNSEVKTEETPKPVEEVLPTIDEIKNNPAEIEKLLVKAEDFMKNNSVSQAFDELNKADDLLNIVNKVIEANSQYLEAPAENQDQTKIQTQDTSAKIEEKVSS